MNFSSDRISFYWHEEPSYQSLSHADSSMYMFHEDLLGNLFNSHRSVNSRVILVPDDKECNSALLSFLFSRRTWRHDMLNAVQETIRHIAQNMYTHGKAFYEIVLTEEMPGQFYHELVYIPYEKYKIQKGNFIQIIPEKVAERFQVKKKYVIPLSKIVCFEWPLQLGGEKGLRRIKQELRRFYEKDPMFSFLGSQMESEAAYDMNYHKRLHDEAMWKITRKIHWVQRKALSNDSFFTEYYYIRRVLLFRKNQIILRDYIIEQVRKSFESIWDESNPVTLTFVLFPSLQDIDKMLNDWQKGQYDVDFLQSVIY